MRSLKKQSTKRLTHLAAAFEVAHSPSLWAILCMAVGATQIGDDTRSPRTVVSSK